MTQREQLVALIKEQKETVGGETKPVVSLEEFFESNEDYGSIGCNLRYARCRACAHPDRLAGESQRLAETKAYCRTARFGCAASGTAGILPNPESRARA